MTTKKKTSPKVERVGVKKTPKGELVTETLTFELTNDEIVAKAESAASLSTELTELRSQFKTVRSEFSANINAVATDLNKLLTCIDVGTEEREVECTKVFVKEDDTVQFWHDGKLMKERPAMEVDRQKAMPFLRKKPEEVQEPKFNGMVLDHKMAAAGDTL